MPPGYLFAPAADWIRELMKREHRIAVYTTSCDVDRPTTFQGERLRIRIAPQRTQGTGRDFFARERCALQRMMREDRCDMIHAHWTYEFALAALASDIPTLVTIHDHPWKVLGHFRDGHRAARLLMAYRTASLGSHFTAVSQGAARHFRSTIKPGASIRVIPNGVPAALFALSCRTTKRTSDGVRFATILQGWSRLKNASAALRAFALVRRACPKARLTMFGLDYEQDGPGQRWACASHLDDGVSFAGALPYETLLQRVSQEVDVIVHPSLNETFSMTILESMALRKAVIVGEKTSGMREMLGNGNGGVFVDVRNPEEIASAMVEVARDPELRGALGDSAYQRALKLYRLEAVMDQYEEMYEETLHAQRRRPCDASL